MYHRVMHRQLQQPAPGKRCDANRTGDLIQSYVEEVLCGPKWRLSMDTEEQKMHAKKRSLTLKAFKMLKGRADGPCRICIPEAAALVASMMGNFRHSQVGGPGPQHTEHHVTRGMCRAMRRRQSDGPSATGASTRSTGTSASSTACARASSQTPSSRQRPSGCCT